MQKPAAREKDHTATRSSMVEELATRALTSVPLPHPYPILPLNPSIDPTPPSASSLTRYPSPWTPAPQLGTLSLALPT